jgi:trichohyalin
VLIEEKQELATIGDEMVREKIAEGEHWVAEGERLGQKLAEVRAQRANEQEGWATERARAIVEKKEAVRKLGERHRAELEERERGHLMNVDAKREEELARASAVARERAARVVRNCVCRMASADRASAWEKWQLVHRAKTHATRLMHRTVCRLTERAVSCAWERWVSDTEVAASLAAQEAGHVAVLGRMKTQITELTGEAARLRAEADEVKSRDTQKQEKWAEREAEETRLWAVKEETRVRAYKQIQKAQREREEEHVRRVAEQEAALVERQRELAERERVALAEREAAHAALAEREREVLSTYTSVLAEREAAHEATIRRLERKAQWCELERDLGEREGKMRQLLHHPGEDGSSSSRRRGSNSSSSSSSSSSSGSSNGRSIYNAGAAEGTGVNARAPVSAEELDGIMGSGMVGTDMMGTGMMGTGLHQHMLMTNPHQHVIDRTTSRQQQKQAEEEHAEEEPEAESEVAESEVRQQELKKVLCMVPSSNMSKELLLTFCLSSGRSRSDQGSVCSDQSDRESRQTEL